MPRQTLALVLSASADPGAGCLFVWLVLLFGGPGARKFKKFWRFGRHVDSAQMQRGTEASIITYQFEKLRQVKQRRRRQIYLCKGALVDDKSNATQTDSQDYVPLCLKDNCCVIIIELAS